MAFEVFNLFAKLGIDSSEYDKGLGEAKSGLSKMGDSIKTGLATAAKVGAAAVTAASTAVVKLTKSAVDGYAEYEQLVGGVDKLFGDASEQLQAYAAEAYKTSGLSANQYMEQATSFSAALINSLGGDTQKAAELADVAMRAMSDNVNTFGSDMGSVQAAFQGFAKQNYTMLDNLKLGYGGTKTEMERLIADANEYAASIGQASDLSVDSFADIVQAIELVQEKQNVAGTTAKEAATTISGSIGMTKAAWQNLVTGLADPNADLGVLIDNMVSSASTAFGNLLPAAEKAIGGIASAVEQIAPLIAEKLPGLVSEILPPLLNAATSLATALAESLPDILQVLIDVAPTIIGSLVNTTLELLPQIVELGLQLLLALANGIAENLPELIPSIVDVILQIVDTLTAPDNLEKLINAALKIILALAEGLIQALPELIRKAPEIIKNLLQAIIAEVPQLLAAGFELVVQLALGMVEAIPELLATVPKLIAALVGGIVDGIKDIVSAGEDLVNGFLEGIKNAWSGLVENVKSLVSEFVDDIKGLLGIHSPSKVFADIGKNMALGVGEGWEKAFSDVDKEINKSFDFGEQTIDFAANMSGAAGGFGVKNSGAGLSDLGGGFGGEEQTFNFEFTLRLDDGTVLQKFARKLRPYMNNEAALAGGMMA